MVVSVFHNDWAHYKVGYYMKYENIKLNKLQSQMFSWCHYCFSFFLILSFFNLTVSIFSFLHVCCYLRIVSDEALSKF